MITGGVEPTSARLGRFCWRLAPARPVRHSQDLRNRTESALLIRATRDRSFEKTELAQAVHRTRGRTSMELHASRMTAKKGSTSTSTGSATTVICIIDPAQISPNAFKTLAMLAKKRLMMILFLDTYYHLTLILRDNLCHR